MTAREPSAIADTAAGDGTAVAAAAVAAGGGGAVPTVRIGVVGAGFISQVVHLPHLRDAAGHFRVVALAEPDAALADHVASRFGIPATFPGHEAMLRAGGLDAVLVCSPNLTHADVTVDALAAGCHVLVEKPLCLTVQDADRVIAARDAAGLVVQVGYMKRFDPAYEALLDDLDGDLAHISTVTVDPGMTPHFGPYAAAAAARGAPDVLSEAFMGALVHDVNAVHGILDALGAEHDAPWIADGWGRPEAAAAGGTVVLPGGLRWTMAWLLIPRAGTFHERIELLGDDGVRRLEFPAPYLRQSPATYTRVQAGGGGSRERRFQAWRGSYARQLEHFHACATDGAECRTPPEQARADVALLAALHDATLVAA